MVRARRPHKSVGHSKETVTVVVVSIDLVLRMQDHRAKKVAKGCVQQIQIVWPSVLGGGSSDDCYKTTISIHGGMELGSTYNPEHGAKCYLKQSCNDVSTSAVWAGTTCAKVTDAGESECPMGYTNITASQCQSAADSLGKIFKDETTDTQVVAWLQLQDKMYF